jgi:hypothetical protein
MSVTFFVPAAPTREIPCEYCISARKDAEMSGEHYGYVHPDGSITCEGYCTGRVRESDAGEVNVANANARVYLRILGLDPDDLHGTIEANALPALLRRILVFRARGEADPHKKRREIALSALPVSNPTLDIGPKTIALFSKEIRKAQLCVCNGTMGVFEQPEFALGTKKIFSALSKTKGFSLLGGGDTLTALTQLKFKPAQFGHVSLAGKALLEYLAGQALPGLAALEQNAKNKTAKHAAFH